MNTRTLPGHPVESGTGYDCNCGGCLSLPERHVEYELGARIIDQRERLAANGAAFTYDRNGLRLGIAALEDELRELYDEWAANKKRLDEPGVAKRLFDEALDVAAVAMLIATASCEKRLT